MISLEPHSQKSSKLYLKGMCILFFFIQALLGFVIHDFYQRIETLEDQSDEYQNELSILKTEFQDLEKSNNRFVEFFSNLKKE